jgi:hypothetical protein
MSKTFIVATTKTKETIMIGIKKGKDVTFCEVNKTHKWYALED